MLLPVSRQLLLGLCRLLPLELLHHRLLNCLSLCLHGLCHRLLPMLGTRHRLWLLSRRYCRLHLRWIRSHHVLLPLLQLCRPLQHGRLLLPLPQRGRCGRLLLPLPHEAGGILLVHVHCCSSGLRGDGCRWLPEPERRPEAWLRGAEPHRGPGLLLLLLRSAGKQRLLALPRW